LDAKFSAALDDGKPAESKSKGGSVSNSPSTVRSQSFSAVATFEYSERGGSLKSIAGVPGSSSLQSATIAVEYDPVQEIETAYAIANPGSQEIEITMEPFSDTGVLLDVPIVFTLLPGRQIARYVHQDFPLLESIRETVVFSTPPGGQFLIMTLAQNKGLYTVMPAAPGASGR
jgi:hypothetical protein